VGEGHRASGTGRYTDESDPPGYYSLPDHARFKFLLNLDGATIAGRFPKLLHTNSVVLKEDSGWVEYYTPLLQSGTHYLTVFNASVFDLFEIQIAYQDRQEDLKAIAAAAQQFAASYLCVPARRLYWVEALTQYRAIFQHNASYNAMDDFIEAIILPALAENKTYYPHHAHPRYGSRVPAT
jgi:hypothetical protein